MDTIAILKGHPELVQEEALELKETHISRVLVGKRRVFKFKKAVRLDFIDQSDLSSRLRLCLREYSLNARLSPEVYLDVILFFESWPITREEPADFRDSGSANSHPGGEEKPSGFATGGTEFRDSDPGRQESERKEISRLQSISWNSICPNPGLRLNHNSRDEATATSIEFKDGLLVASDKDLQVHVEEALNECKKNFGPPLDVCVVMHHLPDADRLEEKLDSLNTSDMRNLASTLASFHRSLPFQPPSSGFAERLNNVIKTLSHLQEVPFATELGDLVRKNRPSLKKRIHREVDGHGDLRPDHIYLREEAVSIIDCVEFSPEIRQVDPFEDVAFTTMGLRLEGQESLARNLALEYLHLYPDVAGYLLLDLYEIYRACVRLMVDSLQLSNLDSGSSDDSARKERLERRSGQYTNLIQDLMKGKKTSFGSAGPWPEPLIIVLMGLPATGKSLIAKLLREDGIPVLSSDIIRKRRQSDLEKRKPAAFGQGIYSAHKKRKNYEHLLALGQKLMRAESRISLDASFSRKEYRNLLLEHCQKTGFAGSILFLETQCSEDVIRKRLNRRKEKGGTSDLTEFSTWKEIEKRFEKLDLNQGTNPGNAGQNSESEIQDYSFRCFHTVLDTSGEKREGSVLPEVRSLLPDLFM